MKIIYKNEAGHEMASLSLCRNWGTSYYLQPFCPNRFEDISSEVWLDLLERAYIEAQKQSVTELQFRLLETKQTLKLAKKLAELGFQKILDRVEFRSNIEALPSENGSPLRWEKSSSSGVWSLEKVAQVFNRVAIGDPDCRPEENKLELLEGYLQDPSLTKTADCIQVGLLDDSPVALVIAQVNPKTGWSRITYMGVDPEYRGHGLGKWVHRHGFEMMRAQGGKLYHGGTVATNCAMIHLFKTHGCLEYRRMQEWLWKA